MTSRKEYCPIASAVGVLGDRWTPLIIRELMVGASGFNEIHRGIPRASRSLLAQRLRELERRGLVDHTANGPGLSGVPPPCSSACSMTQFKRLHPASVRAKSHQQCHGVE